MPAWIIAAAAMTVVTTVALTWVLWRLNANRDRDEQD